MAKLVSLAGIATHVAFGHSYTFGNWATNLNGYAKLFSAEHGLTLLNLGLDGAHCDDAINKVLLNTNPAAVHSMMIGLNDLRDYPSAPSNSIAKVGGTIRAMIASIYSQNATPFSKLARVGFPDAAGVGSTICRSTLVLGGTAQSSRVAGETAEWPFYGNNLVIGYFGSVKSAYPQSRFQVYVDGVSVGIVDPNDQNDGHQTLAPNAARFQGFGPGLHFMRIVTLDQMPVFIDWVGTLKNPIETRPILVLEGAYLSPAGYAYFSTPQFTDATIDQMNAAIDAAVSEYSDFPVVVVPTNSFYNPLTGAAPTPDPVHPKDVGHAQIQAAMDSVLVGSPAPASPPPPPPPPPPPTPIPGFPNLVAPTLGTDGQALFWVLGNNIERISR